jgi:DNA-directed RNA polymerase subunit M
MKMEFCPKCKSMMVPTKKDKSLVLVCVSCGKVGSTQEDAKIKEVIDNKNNKIDLVDSAKDGESLPETDAECPKCKHKKARYWTVQTRAGDEPETKFLRCEKCKHTWRDYS